MARNVADEIEKKDDIGHERDGNLYIPLDVIELDGEKIDLNYYFTQEYTDIGQAAQELPNIIEWVNSQLQTIYEDKLNAEQKLKESEAAAYFDLKGGTYEQVYGGKMTEKSLDYAVWRDEGVSKSWTRLNNLTAWCRRLQNLQVSLQTKLDLIRSSEATRRRLVEPPELELDRIANRRQRQADEQQ